ncbi:MAG: MFS transporter [Desulfobacterales bacterium]|nr:MFS transporter [Desulfobacterales bacterium]
MLLPIFDHLLKAKITSHLYIYALIYGFGYGSLAPTMPYLISNRFGRHVLGSAFGILTFFVGIGDSIGPILGGIIYDLNESYTTAWGLNTVILLFASLLILTLSPNEKIKIASGKEMVTLK